MKLCVKTLTMVLTAKSEGGQVPCRKDFIWEMCRPILRWTLQHSAQSSNPRLMDAHDGSTQITQPSKHQTIKDELIINLTQNKLIVSTWCSTIRTYFRRRAVLRPRYHHSSYTYGRRDWNNAASVVHLVNLGHNLWKLMNYTKIKHFNEMSNVNQS